MRKELKSKEEKGDRKAYERGKGGRRAGDEGPNS